MFNDQKLHHSRACILTLTTQLALKGAVKINDLHLKNSTNNDNKKGNAKFQLHAAADLLAVQFKKITHGGLLLVITHLYCIVSKAVKYTCRN